MTVVPEGMPLPVIVEPTATPTNDATELIVFEPLAVVPVVVAELVEVVVPVSSYSTSLELRVHEPWLCVPGPPVSFVRRLELVSGGNAIRPTRSSASAELQLDWPAEQGWRFESSVDTPAFAQSSLLASCTAGQTPDWASFRIDPVVSSTTITSSGRSRPPWLEAVDVADTAVKRGRNIPSRVVSTDACSETCTTLQPDGSVQ